MRTQLLRTSSNSWQRNLWEEVKQMIFPYGYFTWLHEFKTCPAGDRHCRHYRWVRMAKPE